MKRSLGPALAGTCAVFGFWLGEGGSPPWRASVVIAGIVGGLVLVLTVPGKPWLRVISGVVSLAIHAVAFLGGSLSLRHAHDECIARSEEARIRLTAFHQGEGLYPEGLNRIQGFRLCGCILRPTLLVQERTKEGYVLSFRDWLIEYTAREAGPFLAHKWQPVPLPHRRRTGSRVALHHTLPVRG